MKIVIDLQGVQTGSRERGIGRYTSALTRAFALEANRNHDVWIATNGGLGNVELIRTEFDGIVPQERIVTFSVPVRMRGVLGRARLAIASELIRENFLRSLDADIVWCSSLFEGVGDGSVTSIGHLPTDALQAVTFYDLIPLSRPELISTALSREWYYRKLGYLQRADILLAISEYVRADASSRLSIDINKITNISSAVDKRFHLLGSGDRERWRKWLRETLDLDGPFVLCVGGDDSRKNVVSLIRAFARLPFDIRNKYKLVLAYRISADSEATLRATARAEGLKNGDILFTNYIPDDQLVALYNLCALFVFPSLQEGFGLPVLEAMACGAPVIAADATSLPEVVGRSDMLFSPTSVEELSHKLASALCDSDLAKRYADYGLERAKAFSWQESARKVLAAFESALRSDRLGSASPNRISRPRLAYVSPLPPQQTEVGFFSAELLPALARYYDIEVVVEQPAVEDPWVLASYPIRTAAWFRANHFKYDRVLYHIGNSYLHDYQFGLIEAVPGVVVMHDELFGDEPDWRWTRPGGCAEYLRELYLTHGYSPLLDYQAKGKKWIMENYSSSLIVIEHAIGVIAHSRQSAEKIERYSGQSVLMRVCEIANRQQCRAGSGKRIREQAGLRIGDILVCSFGSITSRNLSQRLLTAWLSSSLARREDCYLAFVGKEDDGDFRKVLSTHISNSVCSKRIITTGPIANGLFEGWLNAADLAVQLGAGSRTESSGPLFDCMARGIPVIANAHGSFGDVDPKPVYLLPEMFEDGALVNALEDFYLDNKKRLGLAKQAILVSKAGPTPNIVAREYRDAIEKFSAQSKLAREQELLPRILSLGRMGDSEIWDIANAIRNNYVSHGKRILFIDVTALVDVELDTDAYLVARKIASELVRNCNRDFRVELVRYDEGDRCFVYARTYACEIFELIELDLQDEVVEVSRGDVFFGLDIVSCNLSAKHGLYQSWRDRGVLVFILVHNLLSILRHAFFGWDQVSEFPSRIVDMCACTDGLLCTSRTFANELVTWCRENGVFERRSFHVGYFYLGADLDGVIRRSRRSVLNNELSAVLKRMSEAPSFLVDGIVGLPDGCQLVLSAMEYLWRFGYDFKLVIIGSKGCMIDCVKMRLQSHPLIGKCLFLLENLRDVEVDSLYKASSALLVASEGEGFCVPMMQAARLGVPIIARDLPVFREIAGRHAHYFLGDDADSLGEVIIQWLMLGRSSSFPRSSEIRWLSWRESSAAIIEMLVNTKHSNWLYSTTSRSISV